MDELKWDLSELFSSIEDPKINQSVEGLHLRAVKFENEYKSKIAVLDIQKMKKMLEEYEQLIAEIMTLEVFAYLEFSADTQKHENGAFLQRMNSLSADITDRFVFLEIEIGKLSDEKYESFLRDEELISYSHFFENLRKWKKFLLSEGEEKVLKRKELTGSSAFRRLYNQELADQKFPLRENGKKKYLTQSEMLNLLYSETSQLNRKAAAKVFTKVLKEKKKLLTFISNTLAADKQANDILRGHSYPEESRHLSNESSKEAVEAMAKAVTQNYAIVHEYYKFKGRVLGIEKLFDYDRYAPLPDHSRTYSFKQAEELILKAFKNFSEEFHKIAKEFFDKKWIDVSPRPGKQSGAYCMYVNPEHHPYVFMNFTGSANDVLTLAHELGHAIHGQLARKQTMLNYNWPLTLSETASIFAETITFQSMVSQMSDEEKLALYMHKIEGIFASVFRQISMYRFEQLFHNKFRSEGELSEKSIDALWRKTQRPMFGKSLKLTKDYDNWWAYISHFVQSPFYVYAYAFGELLTLSLLKKHENGALNFVENYIEFLSLGGSKKPEELLAKFNIQLDDQKFWLGGIELIRDYIRKAETLHQHTLS